MALLLALGAVAVRAAFSASTSSLLASAASLRALGGRVMYFFLSLSRKSTIRGLLALAGIDSAFLISASPLLCIGVCAALGLASPSIRGSPHGGKFMPSLTRRIAIRMRASNLLAGPPPQWHVPTQQHEYNCCHRFA